MNILLNNKEREFYKSDIQELHRLCPGTITKKIPDANIQQGFMLNIVKELCTKESRLLCVGSFEDTACESLVALGYNIIQIDPRINMDLDAFCKNTTEKFDIVFSTSVIEHVEKDEKFLNDMCELLKPGGYGILTCDFNNTYSLGQKKPIEDFRLYTKDDLLIRFKKVLEVNKCNLYGTINYEDKPDFYYGGCCYSFASYTFKKSL